MFAGVSQGPTVPLPVLHILGAKHGSSMGTLGPEQQTSNNVSSKNSGALRA